MDDLLADALWLMASLPADRVAAREAR